jgi:probable HAF family extracellular repeat protein
MGQRWGRGVGRGVVGLLVLGMTFVPAAPGEAAAGGLELTTRALPLLEESGPDAYGMAVAINNRGVIVGGSGLWPTRWRRGEVIPLGETAPAQVARAVAINDRGEVIIDDFGMPLTRWFRGRARELDLGPGWFLAGFNDRGQALVWSGRGLDVRAGVWEPDGSFTPIAAPDGYTAFPLALSEAGHVVGSLRPVEGAGERPFVWKDGRMTVLPGFGVARAVNRRGQVAGTALEADGSNGGAVLWDRGREIRLVPEATPVSGAIDINDRGQVIGSLGSGPNDRHGFVWDEGELVEIRAPSDPILEPEHVNGRGQVVGRYVPDGSAFHAFLWDRGELVDLGESYGTHAINDRGQAVGSLWGENGAQPVVWEVRRT